MNVTVNKTRQDRLVPGGFWKQLMHQCGKGQAQAPAKTYQRQSLEFYRKLPAPHFRAFLQRHRAVAEQLLPCCAPAQVTNQHSAPPKTAPRLQQQRQLPEKASLLPSTAGSLLEQLLWPQTEHRDAAGILWSPKALLGITFLLFSCRSAGYGQREVWILHDSSLSQGSAA